jgi:hypothetical protein
LKALSQYCLFALFLAATAFSQKKTHEIVLVGEVVETQCYVSGLTGPGKGAVHKSCALTCAKNGIPLSILEEGTNTLYLAGQTKSAQSGANKMLIEFVADKVKVSGRVFEKSGIKMIMVSKIERVAEK